MKFYNSLSKQLEEFPKKPHISIYSCGPTVYDYAHIGNLRTFLFEDLLIRTLKSAKYTISHTRNITDVDDKTIERSQAQNISLKEFTTQYSTAFFEDLSNLSFDQSSTAYLKATDYIQDMIQLIEELIFHQYAYESTDGVYFKSSAYKDYGNFAGLDLDNLKEGASCSNLDFQKEDLGDFVLWKKNKGESVFWESPWGKGRPGWHTECAAMVRRQYSEGLDIHTGGIDLLFPHHANEKAHCECLSQKPMAKFWLHATHLLVDNKKMSKSLNNFYTVRDLANQGFDYKSIRFYLQTGAHYRSPLNFTLEGLKGASTALKRINNFIQDLDPQAEGERYPLREKFESHLHNDLNISGAIGEIFTLINNYYNGISYHTNHILEELVALNQILGVLEFPSKENLDEAILELLNQRTLARQAKDWKESDRLRDKLLKQGIEVRDTKEQTTIRKI
ncbi:MAG: cysteine--tRNA ligase [Brevinema sp.]